MKQGKVSLCFIPQTESSAQNTVSFLSNLSGEGRRLCRSHPGCWTQGRQTEAGKDGCGTRSPSDAGPRPAQGPGLGETAPASWWVLVWEGPALPGLGPEALPHPPSPGSHLPLLLGTCPSPLASRGEWGGWQMKYWASCTYSLFKKADFPNC